MYLRDEDVSGLLRFVREHSRPGSTLVFDYVTRAFFDGDYSSYGARELARGWRRMGNVNRSAIASVDERLAPFGLKVLSDIGSGGAGKAALLESGGVSATSRLGRVPDRTRRACFRHVSPEERRRAGPSWAAR